MSKFYTSSKVWTVKDGKLTWSDALHMFEAKDMKSALRQVQLLLSQDGREYEVESIKIELEKFPLAKKPKS